MAVRASYRNATLGSTTANYTLWLVGSVAVVPGLAVVERLNAMNRLWFYGLGTGFWLGFWIRHWAGQW